MVTGSFRLIVADDPALACFPTVRHWLSEPVGGLVTVAGSVFGTRISRLVPLPLRPEVDRADRDGLAEVDDQSDAALQTAELGVAQVLHGAPARLGVAVDGELGLAVVLVVGRVALRVEGAGAGDRSGPAVGPALG